MAPSTPTFTGFIDDEMIPSNQWSAGFEDHKRGHKIDKLMELGISEYISLPQLVVVGDQSSGKSSVLEGLTNLPFPRHSSLCTRFATQIVFRKAAVVNISVSIIPSASCEPKTKSDLECFKKDGLKSLSAEEFESILSKACTAMGVPAPGEPAKSHLPAFSKHIFQVELQGPEHNHLSVIDVPGIFRSPMEGVTTTIDILLVNQMIQRFIKNKRTIILAVLPANVDIATQEILEMAKDVDPKRQRTLAVLTKPDLVDKGAEKEVIDLVQGKRNRLRLGYYVVKNRGQDERDISSAERHRKESEFFLNGPFSALPKDRVGIPNLHEQLRTLLDEITQREYPHVKRDISERILACEDELKDLGPNRETDDKQRQFLTDLAAKFQDMVKYALECRYGRDSFFEDQAMRLATRIVSMNDTFSDAMQKTGCTVDFENEESASAGHVVHAEEAPPPPPAISVSSEGDLQSRIAPSDASDFGESGPPVLTLNVDDYPELSDVIPKSYEDIISSTGNVLGWIKQKYTSSRGFELGTFNPAILTLLFHEQTRNWAPLTMNYLREVIVHIHRFCDHLLHRLCPDERTRTNVWSLVTEKLLQMYKKAVDHAKFLLCTERDGNLITTNHYFSDNLERLRLERLTVAARELSVPLASGPYSASKRWVDVDNVVRIASVDNVQHTVQDIHDILRAYYKVSRKRFVDSVCLQATDYLLLSGPETLDEVFSPVFVSSLTPETLNRVAGEDSGSIQRRKELVRQIESLREGKKVLSS